jgi:hypothetical protein
VHARHYTRHWRRGGAGKFCQKPGSLGFETLKNGFIVYAA